MDGFSWKKSSTDKSAVTKTLLFHLEMPSTSNQQENDNTVLVSGPVYSITKVQMFTCLSTLKRVKTPTIKRVVVGT